MPTKPVTTFTFATNTNYTSGPFIGNSTKVIPGDLLNGFVPGTGIASENSNYLWHYTGSWISDWLSQGTSTAALDAHIIETDANGTSNIASAVLGFTTDTLPALLVRNNSGSLVLPTSGFENQVGRSAIFAINSGGLDPAIFGRTSSATSAIQGEHTGTGGFGVVGTGTGTNNGGVYGAGTGNGEGITGLGGPTGRGVQGTGGSTSGAGVVGFTGAAGQNGVEGFSNAGGGGSGVFGSTGGINSHGVFGRATGFAGTYGVLAVSDGGSDGALRAYGNGTGANHTPAIIADGRGELGTGEGYGLIAFAKVATPVRSALRLAPQQGDPSSAADGDIAYNDNTDELRAHIDGQWQSVCSLPLGDTFGFETGQAALNNDAVNYTVIANATLAAPKDPKHVGLVLISASGEFGWDTTVGASIDVRIWDDTSNVVVWARSIETPVSVGTGVYDRPWSIQIEYLLPAVGPRTFELQFKKPNPADDAVIAIDASIYVRGVF